MVIIDHMLLACDDKWLVGSVWVLPLIDLSESSYSLGAVGHVVGYWLASVHLCLIVQIVMQGMHRRTSDQSSSCTAADQSFNAISLVIDFNLSSLRPLSVLYLIDWTRLNIKGVSALIPPANIKISVRFHLYI